MWDNCVSKPPKRGALCGTLVGASLLKSRQSSYDSVGDSEPTRGGLFGACSTVVVFGDLSVAALANEISCTSLATSATREGTKACSERSRVTGRNTGLGIFNPSPTAGQRGLSSETERLIAWMEGCGDFAKSGAGISDLGEVSSTESRTASASLKLLFEAVGERDRGTKPGRSKVPRGTDPNICPMR
jgi:hypothetical protein